MATNSNASDISLKLAGIGLHAEGQREIEPLDMLPDQASSGKSWYLMRSMIPPASATR